MTMANDLKVAVQELRSFSSNTDKIVADLQLMLVEINKGEGAAGTLIADSIANENIKQSLDNLQKGSKAFNEIMEALKQNFLFRRYFKKQESDKKK